MNPTSFTVADVARMMVALNAAQARAALKRAAMFDYQDALILARRSNRPDPCHFTVLDESAKSLPALAGNVTSQNGEDGLLAAVFDKIGVANRHCFEVGAGDGLELSNTWLLRQAGWQALLIEADDQRYAELFRRFAGTAALVHERVGPHSLDCLLDLFGFPAAPDLGVIDVDGEDLAVWRGLVRFRPRVMLVEFNVGGDGKLGPPHDCWQWGAEAVEGLGRARGYLPLLRCGCNVLLVDDLTWREAVG